VRLLVERSRQFHERVGATCLSGNGARIAILRLPERERTRLHAHAAPSEAEQLAATGTGLQGCENVEAARRTRPVVDRLCAAVRRGHGRISAVE
jgi:hypothetical protein